jgi:hypothetical protein
MTETVTDYKAKPCVLIEGNPVEGFIFTGPFPDWDAAIAYADKAVGGDWWLAPIDLPV